MQVSPSQLIPGCIVTENIYGKTHQPIVSENTVVTEQHILFLVKFLIAKVEVAPRLADGTAFIPEEAEEETPVPEKSIAEKKEELFSSLYHKTVLLYKELFSRWQGNTSIDISVVRRVIFPLIDRMEEAEDDLLFLYRYSEKEDYFYHHSIATAILSAYTAKKSNFPDYRLTGLAGFLADCGMAKIDYDLIRRSGALTPSEYEEIKKHPAYSYRLIENISSLPLKVKLGVLQHHEKIDGSGYPLGVQKDKLHPFAACIAISDAYHAMTSDRYHQSSQSPYITMEKILYEEFGKYDPVLAHTFVSSLLNFSSGTLVKLSDNREAEVVFMDENYLTRPVVRLLDTKEILYLKNNKQLSIAAVLS